MSVGKRGARHRSLGVGQGPESRTPNARYRTPLPLLPDATSGANAAPGLRTVAATLTARLPALASSLQRYARQLEEAKTAAQTVTAWTETPQPNASVSDNSVNDAGHAEGTLIERAATETLYD